MTRKIVIIGGGPAGVEAALAAKQTGTIVTIISDGPIGGRAGWHSLLPSRVWLSEADTIAMSGDPARPVERLTYPDLSPASVLQRIRQVKESWNIGLESGLGKMGVDIVQGTASFIANNKVEVRPSEGKDLVILEGDAFIVASGSIPVFPPNLKPDGKSVIAPRFASHLDNLPQSMIVVGAGATGCESAYLFNRFGVEVTWIVDQFGILPQMDRNLGSALGNALIRQGVRLIQGQMVERLEQDTGVTAVLADDTSYRADMAFVAVGRKPDWGRINLSAAGLTPDADGQIKTDGYGRTDNMKIYLVGDAAGGAMVANKATAQARTAGLHAAGVSVNPFHPEHIVRVTYTEPQAAQVGDTQVAVGVRSARIPFALALKAHLIDANDGFLELFYNVSDRRLRGAMAFGSHAADVLTSLVVALYFHATIDQMAEIYAPHPTLSELAFIAARAG
jgi:pyruvate/2-oxoglutarate dehydrogenase complex dihydrolipoamide dehydrogenase (E3) component